MHWLDILLKNLFKEKKVNKGSLEYSFQKSSSSFCILLLGVIKNPSKNVSTKFKILGKIFPKMFFEIFKNAFWGTPKKQWF